MSTYFRTRHNKQKSLTLSNQAFVKYLGRDLNLSADRQARTFCTSDGT